MTTALTSAINSADTAQAPMLPGSAEAKTSDARSAATDFLQLERLGAPQVLVHGIHDAEGRAISLFTFACRPGSAGQRQAYLVQLLAPSLHAAWVRTQLSKRAETSGDKAAGGSVLTVRELD